VTAKLAKPKALSARPAQASETSPKPRDPQGHPHSDKLSSDSKAWTPPGSQNSGQHLTYYHEDTTQQPLMGEVHGVESGAGRASNL
jgi:hypothetical protein